MKTFFTLLAAIGICGAANAQHNPYLDYWWLNTNNHTTNGIVTDVSAEYYDSNYVYIKSSGIPSYVVFGATHNDPADKNYTYRISRHPQQNTGTPTSALGGGGYGVLLDGSQLFNPEDARSYNNANVWHQIAYFFEGVDFDTTSGHSTPTNEYHHHVGPTNYYNSDSSKHSKLVGFCFDGFPLYGPFGYSDPNDTTSAITRMTPSYQKRNISNRNTLPDGTVSPGPPINNTYPLGGYREDYEYDSASGTLDAHNGRWCKTPDFPNGTYCYFITVDANMTPIYPYMFGQSLYGITDNQAFGPNGQHYTVPSNAVEYVPDTSGNDTTTGIIDVAKSELQAALTFGPNPVSTTLNIRANSQRNLTILLFSLDGKLLATQQMNDTSTSVDVSGLAGGMYLVNITDNVTDASVTARFIKH